MPRLRQNEHERAVGMVQAGMRHEDVANQFGCSKLTITRLMSRVRQADGTADHPRSGRPRVTSTSRPPYSINSSPEMVKGSQIPKFYIF